MTILEVSAVAPESDGSVVCQVLCRQGFCRVGDRLTIARRSDGAVATVDLVVAEITGAAGSAPQIETYAIGRVRVAGVGAELVAPGVRLESVATRELTSAVDPGWPAHPGGVVPALGEGERPDLYVEGATHLSRWSTAFRLVLAIPHYVVLYVLTLVAQILLVIGWFAALATGRLPTWVFDFVQGVVAYQTGSTATTCCSPTSTRPSTSPHTPTRFSRSSRDRDG